MTKRLLIPLLLLLCATPAFANCTAFYYDPVTDSILSRTNTGTAYYFDFVGGADANAGTSTGAPWKHHPFFQGWTGTYNHAVGDCFYFKGGVTWDSSNWRLNITSGGGTSNQDYYGPDPTHTWFTGGSWSRPIWDYGAAVLPSGTGGNMVNYNVDHVIIDNIEVIRMFCDSTHASTLFSTNAKNDLHMNRNYVHNFRPISSAGCGTSADGPHIKIAAAGCCATNTGFFTFNVVDGSDGTTGIGGYITEVLRDNLYGLVVWHNVIHDVCSAVNISQAHSVSYNLIYKVGPWSGAPFNCSSGSSVSAHPDGIQLDQWADIHDNVLFDVTGEVINFVPNVGNDSHIYNNVCYLGTPACILVGNVSGTNPGNTYLWNNTLSCGDVVNNVCIRVGSATTTLVEIHNEHHITVGGGTGICINAAPINDASCASVTTFNYTAADNTFQTYAAANAQGYNGSQGFVYSPTLSTNSTVTAIGTNLTSSCTSSILLCVDTEYGTKQVIPGNTAGAARGQFARPAGGNWQSGAYSFDAVTLLTPTFSPVAGTYIGTQAVSILIAGGTTGCYTIDGSTPTGDNAGNCTHGTTYSTPISVASSLTIQAIFTKSGFHDSNVGSSAYVINASPPVGNGTNILVSYPALGKIQITIQNDPACSVQCTVTLTCAAPGCGPTYTATTP